MKKKFLTGIILAGTLLAGCEEKDNSLVLGEGLPEGFEAVSQLVIESNATYEIKHIETGCHYILSGNYGALTGMYKEDGKPYCTE